MVISDVNTSSHSSFYSPTFTASSTTPSTTSSSDERYAPFEEDRAVNSSRNSYYSTENQKVEEKETTESSSHTTASHSQPTTAASSLSHSAKETKKRTNESKPASSLKTSVSEPSTPVPQELSLLKAKPLPNVTFNWTSFYRKLDVKNLDTSSPTPLPHLKELFLAFTNMFFEKREEEANFKESSIVRTQDLGKKGSDIYTMKAEFAKRSDLRTGKITFSEVQSKQRVLEYDFSFNPKTNEYHLDTFVIPNSSYLSSVTQAFLGRDIYEEIRKQLSTVKPSSEGLLSLHLSSQHHPILAPKKA